MSRVHSSFASFSVFCVVIAKTWYFFGLVWRKFALYQCDIFRFFCEFRDYSLGIRSTLINLVIIDVHEQVTDVCVQRFETRRSRSVHSGFISSVLLEHSLRVKFIRNNKNNISLACVQLFPTLPYASSNSYASFVLSKLPACFISR